MSHHDTWRTRRLYRTPHKGRLMGVCAGLSDYFGCNVTLTRILAIIALFWFHALALIAYLALGVMLPTKPDPHRDCESDEEHWRDTSRSGGNNFCDHRDRFGEPAVKWRRREAYDRSRRYELERQFRDLEH